MIYILLIVFVSIIAFASLMQKGKTEQVLLLSFVTVSFFASMCFLLLYVCKDSLRLSVFLDYFPFPRKIVLSLYSLKISKVMVMRMLNLSCLTFLFSNVWFTGAFLSKRTPAGKNRWLLISGIFYLAQAVFYDPDFYVFVYSRLYPGAFSSTGLEDFFSRAADVTNIMNLLILLTCVVLVCVEAVKSPNIKMLRINMIGISVFYSLLIISYGFFFYKIPGAFVRYSKVADTKTFKPVVSAVNMNFFRYYPYVIFVLLLLFAVSVLSLSVARKKLNSYNLEVTQNIKAANMSSRLFCHYMKNEILAISAEVENIPVSEETRESVEELQQRCESIYQKLDGIHKSMRDNTKHMRQVALSDVVTSAVDYVQQSSRAEGVQVQTQFPELIPYVFVDPVYLEQALIELLYNACDAMTDSEVRELTLSVDTRMRFVVLRVADTGCGIEDRDVTNIFTPLFSSKPSTKNWGIGLTLTHKIITGFHGRIDVSSERGKGTVFEILLPSGGQAKRKEPDESRVLNQEPSKM